MKRKWFVIGIVVTVLAFMMACVSTTPPESSTDGQTASTPISLRNAPVKNSDDGKIAIEVIYTTASENSLLAYARHVFRIIDRESQTICYYAASNSSSNPGQACLHSTDETPVIYQVRYNENWLYNSKIVAQGYVVDVFYNGGNAVVTIVEIP